MAVKFCNFAKLHLHELLTYSPALRMTHLIQTPHYYGQFDLSLSKKSYTFSLNSTHLNTNTLLTWTDFMAPSVSVLTGFHFITLKLGKFTHFEELYACQLVDVNI